MGLKNNLRLVLGESFEAAMKLEKNGLKKSRRRGACRESISLSFRLLLRGAAWVERQGKGANASGSTCKASSGPIAHKE